MSGHPLDIDEATRAGLIRYAVWLAASAGAISPTHVICPPGSYGYELYWQRQASAAAARNCRRRARRRSRGKGAWSR